MGKREPVLFQIGWNACIQCGACIAICPQKESFVSAFDTIAVDRPCDIACMKCEDICPVTTITHIPVPSAVTPSANLFVGQ
ncbi:MAG: 4Fe-4S binding protein [Bacteroidota bacterium]